MSLVLKKKNGSPLLSSRLFETDLLSSVFDLNNELFDLNGTVVPNANIIETEKEFKLDLAVPGLDRKDLKVEVEKGILTISAEKEEEKKEENKNYRRKEFSYHSFSRSFTLPENLVADKIEAKYENGILHVVLPKKEVSVTKPAREIKVS